MRKILIMMLISSLVLVSGCAGKKDKNNQNPNETQNKNATNQQETNIENTQKKEDKYTVETAKEVTNVDINDMTQADLDKLVEMFNSETSTPDEKEAAKVQLEQIFKNAGQ